MKKKLILIFLLIFNFCVLNIWAINKSDILKEITNEDESKYLDKDLELIEKEALAKTIKKNTKKMPKEFFVYKDFGYKENNFIPTGWMGDVDDLKLTLRFGNKPYKGQTCLKLEYSAKRSNNSGWAGIYFQYPANNWGDKKQGYNLQGYKTLTFWAKGEKGGELISKFNVGGIIGAYPDSSSASLDKIILTKKWQQYIIKLKDKDLTHIIGGFCLAMSGDENPNGFAIYLDEIKFQK